jgi:hypothetical protein
MILNSSSTLFLLSISLLSLDNGILFSSSFLGSSFFSSGGVSFFSSTFSSVGLVSGFREARISFALSSNVLVSVGVSPTF